MLRMAQVLRPSLPPRSVVTEISSKLAASTPRRLSIAGFRRAAVLVPVLQTATGPELLFTVRAAGMRSHAGQIAFPGGRLEPGEDSVDAAVREAAEEVGLEVSRGDILGALSDHPSPAGYVATPVVACVRWPQQLSLDTNEVDEVFLVPLADLMAIEPGSEFRELESYRRRLYSYPWNGRNIWGFTGNVVRNLLDVLAGSAGDDFDTW